MSGSIHNCIRNRSEDTTADGQSQQQGMIYENEGDTDSKVCAL